MKYLVTGAAGFIGYHLSQKLLDCGGKVIMVDNFSRGADDDAYRALARHRNATAINLDLTDPTLSRELPEQVDVVFHLAALNGTQNFYERPYDVLHLSTLPTFYLLKKYQNQDLLRFVFAGSSEAYAGTVSRFNWPVPTSEDVPLCVDDPFNSRWSYAVSKLHGEVLTIHGCRQFGLPFTVLRYHNVYGPRMGDNHVVPDFLVRARAGIYALHGYEDTRSFLYVDDAVDATIKLAHAQAAAGEIVNVGSPTETSIADLGQMIMDVCGLEGSIAHYPSPPGSVPRRVPDIGKMSRLIDFTETVSLEEGLARTASFYLGRDVSMPGKQRAEPVSAI